MDENSQTRRKYNRLENNKSPYLLQHATNPVDWYPWGEEAFARAREEDKPIFLSIGYATCHWCHVMAHESFEDDTVAALLNQSFVSIKVDREERPDIDQIYMSACQALTGSGGWPLSVFMTPEGRPFFAGTYFPKDGRMGMMGFKDLVKQIASLWREDRDRALRAGDSITGHIQPELGPAGEEEIPPDRETLKRGAAQLEESFDAQWGGFGRAPKFPTPHQLGFLLRWHERTSDADALRMVEKTLRSMRNGGICDQIGYGFHRYSVDENWLVPHFEKMLYDQALLAIAYLDAFQATRKSEHGTAAREIFRYVLRDMQSPEGGFYCAEDADSEGREGFFYLWTPEQVLECLGSEVGALICRFYDITEAGNYEEGLSIPHVNRDASVFARREGMEPEVFGRVLEAAREKLFRHRERRVHPLKDDKILTAWNGLMISALARGFQVLEENDYLDGAERAFRFILDALRDPAGRLLRRYRKGNADYPGYLDDYAFLVWAAIELYEGTFNIEYLERALELTEAMIDIFWDERAGGFYFTGAGNEILIARSKEVHDGALPSGNSVSALNLLRLGRLTGDASLEQRAQRLILAFSREVRQYPPGFTHLLMALDFMLGPGQELVVVGGLGEQDAEAMLDIVRRNFMPRAVVLFRPEGDAGEKTVRIAPFVKEMKAVGGAATAYLCRDYACREPVSSAAALSALISSSNSS